MNRFFAHTAALLAAALLLTACQKVPTTSSSEIPVDAPVEIIVESYPFFNPLREPPRISHMAPIVPPSISELSQITQISSQNSDAKGWLNVPGTTINDAVLKGRDNNRYLRANNFGRYAFEGCYFVDYRNTLLDRSQLDQNTIIYGHNLGKPQNMKDDPNGDKFAQLLKYDSLDFARENAYFTVTTPTDRMVFKIFATFYSDTNFYYIEPNFKTTNAFLDFVEETKARSEHNFDVDVGPLDRVMTLSTCTYKYGSGWVNHNQRFVVMGRLVRLNETENDPVQVEKNPTPKAPQF